MSVSCRVTAGYFSFLEHRGFSVPQFIDSLKSAYPNESVFNFEFLNNPRNRITWNQMILFTNKVSELFPNKCWHKQFVEDSMNIKNGWALNWHRFGRLVFGPKQAYILNNKLFGPANFGESIEKKFEVLEDGRFLVTLSIKEGLSPFLTFFEISAYGLAKVPSIIGLPDAVVECEVSPAKGLYYITPPPTRSIPGHIVRFFKSIFLTPFMARELILQDQQLRRSYDELVKSEQELHKTKARLEEMVKERTRELEISKAALEEHLKELIEMNRENRELQNRLLDSQKLEAIGTFIGGISHEINNVLQGITLSLDLAQKKIPEASDLNEFNLARTFSNRGRDLMKQVLSFSRKVETEKKVVDFLSTLTEAVALIRSTAPRNIQLVENLNLPVDKPVYFLGDKVRLQQIVVNLCNNAFHSMGDKSGKIEIKATLSSSLKDLVLEVQDEGSGIPKEIQARIFEPFFTTKGVGQGSGMGLAVVHGIVEDFGGRIELNSEPGKGTKFRIFIPHYREPIPQEIVESATPQTNLQDKYRILVVDDEPDLARILADLLGKLSHDVVWETEPLKAITTLSKQSFDIIITDYSMPLMNGVEFARKAQKIQPQARLILSTGFLDQDQLNAADVVFASKLMKPFGSQNLEEAIHKAGQIKK